VLRRLLILACAVLLAGCSSFRLGAFCYLPAGNAGACELSTVPAIESARPAT
jgi:hypothetical protein